jgi:hypothetical protein
MSTDDNLMWLSENAAKRLKLPDDARAYLLTMFQLIQWFDDVVDGDPVTLEQSNKAIFAALYQLPNNPFFLRHREFLAPIVACAILKWQAADAEERKNNPSATAFVWRASFYDLVLACMSIVHGPDIGGAVGVMNMYGEDFEAYKKEFLCQTQ